MSDFIVVNGDQVIFRPQFGAAVITPMPGEITGSGPATLGGEAICIEGDEASVEVKNVPYVAPPFVGGLGTLTIDALGDDQLTQKTSVDGTPVILVGSQLTAKLTVDTKGLDPNGNQDATPEYSGQGQFLTFNRKLQGT